MITMRLALTVALLTLAVVSDAKAAGPNLPGPPPTQKAVAECAAQVRTAIPLSVFGAYVDPRTGDVRSFGSEQERELFSKCLARRGASEKLTPKGPPR
jgi:hypothetical protein